MNKFYYDTEHKLLFKKGKDEYFIPIMYDVVVDDKNKYVGKIISKTASTKLGRAMYDFITFVRYSGNQFDTETGEQLQGHAEIYQYIIAFEIIKHLILLDSADIMAAISRQAGKSHISRLVIAFSIVFMPMYVDFVGTRFYATLCSFKKDTAQNQLLKVEGHITDAIKLFNELHPEKPLVSDDYVEENGRKRKLKWNKNTIEINRKIGDNTIPYSSLDVLGLKEGADTPGYTSTFMFLDEAQLINLDFFNEIARNFVNATGGVTFAVGTANRDETSVLYDFYRDKGMAKECKIIYTVEDVVKFKKMVKEENGRKYEAAFLKDLRKYGKNSTFIRTQYYVDFQAGGNNFITKELLIENNILTGELTRRVSDDADYVVISVDPALKNDIASLIVAEVYELEDRYITNIIDLVMLRKKDDGIKSPTEIVDEIARYCAMYKADYLSIDTTANQEDRAYYLYKKLEERGINTMIVPMNYAGNLKQTFMGYLEDSIYNQSLILPHLDTEDPAYVELIRELVSLLKIRHQSGRVEYRAPKSDEHYDDMAMALGTVNYTIPYVKLNINKKIDLGGDVVYYIKEHKYNDDNDRVKFGKIKSWLFG